MSENIQAYFQTVLQMLAQCLTHGHSLEILLYLPNPNLISDSDFFLIINEEIWKFKKKKKKKKNYWEYSHMIKVLFSLFV